MSGFARRAAAALAVLAAVAGAAACGDDDGAGETTASGKAGNGQLTVSAARSLKDAFTAYGEKFTEADVKFQFAGSDELAAQIRKGVKPDVFASANTKLPDELFKEGLVETPVVFAGNRLVIAVPADGDAINGIDDLTKPGVKIAVGAKSVPVGSYTRKVLDRLPGDVRREIENNIRSEEPDVGGVVGKISQGAVDAGFVYITDVQAAGGKLEAVELPRRLQPSVAYGAAVVKGTKNPQAAKAFIDGLLAGPGAEALQQAGFEPPPAQ